MRKDEFLERLEMLLSDISQEEREEAMAFYRSYFEDAGIGNEARILAELESPENVAETIKRDLGMITVSGDEETWESYKEEPFKTYENSSDAGTSDTYYKWTDSKQEQTYTDYQQGNVRQEKDKSWVTPLLIVLAVITFPTWFGILAGIIGTVFGLSVALIAITFATLVVGVVFVGLGIAMLAGLGAAIVSIPVGLVFVGAGLLVLALAMFLLLACVGVFGKLLPWACKGIYQLCRKPFVKKEEQVA